MKKALLILWVVLTLGLFGVSGYLFMENRDLNNNLSLSDEERRAQKNSEIYAAISSLISLPAEEPIYILVNDPEKALEENPGIGDIFDDLKKDDYLLVFRKDRSAIQFRPSENKIIKNSTISLPVSVHLVGSESAIKAAEDKLAVYGNQVTITSEVDSDIEKSSLYLINNKLIQEAENIAGTLSIEVISDEPENINKSDSMEIVIVLADNSRAETNPDPTN